MKDPLKNAWQALLHNPSHIVFAIYRRMPWLIPNDKLYLKIYYWLSLRRKLNLNPPVLFNEKLQWLKLYYRNPELVQLVDKYRVKAYVASVIGEEYVIPTLGVWNRPGDIEWDKLPNQFVLKTNHDGGGNGIVVCKDKNKFSKYKALKELRHSFYRSSYMIGREWPYKQVQRKVFAEKYMEDIRVGELRDYKFFCFNGEVKMMYIASNRGKSERVSFDFFDMDFNHLDIKNDHPNAVVSIEKPKSFKKMIEFASSLSKGFPHVRIDFYEVDGNPYFGEFTFYHLGGTGTFQPEKWDELFGNWIELPNKYCD